jgi:hypothetical protein
MAYTVTDMAEPSAKANHQGDNLCWLVGALLRAHGTAVRSLGGGQPRRASTGVGHPGLVAVGADPRVRIPLLSVTATGTD